MKPDGSFDLELALAVEVVRDGLRRLLSERAYEWSEEGDSSFSLALRRGITAVISVTAIEPDVPAFPLFPSRCRLSACPSESAAEDMAKLRRDIALAFLRIAG